MYSRVFVGAFSLLLSFEASSHTIKQSGGAYRDNQGLQRNRVGLDGALDFSTGGEVLTNTAYTLGISRDTFTIDDLSSNKYQNTVYGTATRRQDSASVTASQTWHKITDTRILGTYATDGKVKSRTIGVGASQWVGGETWQLSCDLSRTVAEKPEFEILDFDFETVSPPTNVNSTGTTVGVRNLTTPTTITLASYTQIAATDRPVTRVGSFGIRQFIVPADGALHLSGTRAYNRGKVTTETTYGEVDAWQADVAWLQTLWRGATGRIGYRWYKEDETTRAYGDELVYGSDMVSAGLAQDLPKMATFKGREVPMSLELSGTRYVSNARVSAGSVEMGLSGKF